MVLVASKKKKPKVPSSRAMPSALVRKIQGLRSSGAAGPHGPSKYERRKKYKPDYSLE